MTPPPRKPTSPTSSSSPRTSSSWTLERAGATLSAHLLAHLVEFMGTGHRRGEEHLRQAPSAIQLPPPAGARLPHHVHHASRVARAEDRRTTSLRLLRTSRVLRRGVRPPAHEADSPLPGDGACGSPARWTTSPSRRSPGSRVTPRRVSSASSTAQRAFTREATSRAARFQRRGRAARQRLQQAPA